MARSPFANIPWANTQKHAVNAHFDRHLLFGAIIGEDDELLILRHAQSGFHKPLQAGVTVASQTGLHIQSNDTRDGVNLLKLTRGAGAGAGHVIEYTDADAPGIHAYLTNGGTWTDSSLAESKQNMVEIEDNVIEDILSKVKVYHYQYIKEPGINYVSPEAEEFTKLTGTGDGRSMSAKTVGSYALRAVKRLWKRMQGYDTQLDNLKKKVAALELQLADGTPDDQPAKGADGQAA